MSRVNPPKTTMPKTLTALPNNQYATDLSLISGKLEFLVADSPATIASCSICFGFGACVDCHLTAFRMKLCGAAGRTGRIAGRKGAFEHALHERSCRDRRGAAALSRGKAWKREAMANGGGVGGERTLSLCFVDFFFGCDGSMLQRMT